MFDNFAVHVSERYYPGASIYTRKLKKMRHLYDSSPFSPLNISSAPISSDSRRIRKWEIKLTNKQKYENKITQLTSSCILLGKIMYYYYIHILNFRIHESQDFIKIESFGGSIVLIRHEAITFFSPVSDTFRPYCPFSFANSLLILPSFFIDLRWH